MEIGKFIFVMYLQDRNFFQKIALLFGKDVIVSRWLKQHGNKPLQKIAASMPPNKIDEAIDFFEDNAVCVYERVPCGWTAEYLDTRVGKILTALHERKSSAD